MTHPNYGKHRDWQFVNVSVSTSSELYLDYVRCTIQYILYQTLYFEHDAVWFIDHLSCCMYCFACLLRKQK